MNIDELRQYNRPALAYLLEFPPAQRKDVMAMLKQDADGPERKAGCDWKGWCER